MDHIVAIDNVRALPRSVAVAPHAEALMPPDLAGHPQLGRDGTASDHLRPVLLPGPLLYRCWCDDCVGPSWLVDIASNSLELTHTTSVPNSVS